MAAVYQFLKVLCEFASKNGQTTNRVLNVLIGQREGVDFRMTLLLDSLERFWSVAGLLEAGRAVDEPVWEALFHTVGYRVLATEFPPSALRRRFELAFSPGRAAEAQGDAADDWLLAHYLWVKAERPAIAAFAARLDATRLCAEAMERTSLWLPPEAVAGAVPPDVALAIFDADARGCDPVVVDAGFAYLIGETGLGLLLAHEFHHWFRNRAGVRLPPVPEDLAWVLDQIQAEGIADQINVPEMLGEQAGEIWSGWAKAYRQYLAQAPAFLAEMDRILVQMALAPDCAAAEAGRLRQMLQMAGHPVGYHMTCRIVEAGNREALVASFTDPVRFFRLYREACQALGYLEGHRGSTRWEAGLSSLL